MPGYTNYQESSTDNCSGTASLCTNELPFNISKPPDVWLDARVTVPTIILRVDNIRARLNLDARVASLVNLTAGVSVGIRSVELKILGLFTFARFSSKFSFFSFVLGVNAHAQLAVRFDKIVEIVNKTLESLDLNPLLGRTITAVQNTIDNVL